jgi:hypothetical protein
MFLTIEAGVFKGIKERLIPDDRSLRIPILNQITIHLI